MAHGMVHFMLFAMNCDAIEVKQISDIEGFFSSCRVFRSFTFISSVYTKINEIFNAKIKVLRLEKCKMEITIFSDFDCMPANPQMFKQINTDLRFIRIANTEKSVKFQTGSMNFQNQLLIKKNEIIEHGTAELDEDTDDIDEDEYQRRIAVETQDFKRKKVDEMEDIPTTELLFTEADCKDKVLRPLKKQKSGGASDHITKWGR